MVADESGYAQAYVRELCNTGVVEALKIGNTWVIEPKQFNKLMSRKETMENRHGKDKV